MVKYLRPKGANVVDLCKQIDSARILFTHEVPERRYFRIITRSFRKNYVNFLLALQSSRFFMQMTSYQR